MIRRTPEALQARQKLGKGVPFPGSLNTILEFGVVHKTRIEGIHQTLTLGVLQIFDTMQPGGPMGPLKLSKIRLIPGLQIKS